MNSAQRRQKKRQVKVAMAIVGFEAERAKLDRRERDIANNEANSAKHLANQKKIFEDWCNEERGKIVDAQQRMAEDRTEWAQVIETHKVSMAAERELIRQEAQKLPQIDILRETLLELECGLDPIDIATRLRKKFDLLIPTW